MNLDQHGHNTHSYQLSHGTHALPPDENDMRCPLSNDVCNMLHSQNVFPTEVEHEMQHANHERHKCCTTPAGSSLILSLALFLLSSFALLSLGMFFCSQPALSFLWGGDHDYRQQIFCETGLSGCPVCLRDLSYRFMAIIADHRYVKVGDRRQHTRQL